MLYEVITPKSIDYAVENGYTLVVALDCGIKAVDKIAKAKERGLDFIICDHHNPGEKVPDAAAVLDPKQPGCNYPRITSYNVCYTKLLRNSRHIVCINPYGCVYVFE